MVRRTGHCGCSVAGIGFLVFPCWSLECFGAGFPTLALELVGILGVVLVIVGCLAAPLATIH